ncbi:MAG: DMT family transporter [Pseudomonadota bacterium]
MLSNIAPAKTYSDTTLSVLLAFSAAAWGVYWYPLRTIEEVGITGSWAVVYFNVCPLLVLCPLLILHWRKLLGMFWPTLTAAVMIGLAFTFYANGLVETTVIRATMLYYLTPVWSTILGVLWLSEKLTRARIVAIVVAFFGLFLLLYDDGSSTHPINIGDLYSLLSGVFWAFGIATLNRWPRIPIVPLATIIFIATTGFSLVFAMGLYADPVPQVELLQQTFITAAFWSVFVLLPCFCIIFRISQVLFPGRVGILTMTEVIVAVISASILLPEESMQLLQWVGAAAIVLAGLVEVVFGYSRSSVSVANT